MLFFLLIIVVLMITGMEIAPQGAIHEDYMSRERNNDIKGIFILMILMRHYAQYCTLESTFDMAYYAVRLHIGQCVVAMFLFYSGYGMMESIRRKGFPYVRRIPAQRFLKVWWQFFAVILVYLVLDLILGYYYPLPHVLLSFIGYTSIGASNWYMFAIFYLYLLTFVAFLVIKWKNNTTGYILGIAILYVLTIGAVLWQMKIGRYPYTYNTMLVYPLGMVYSLLRPAIESLLRKNALWYSGAFLLCMMFYMYVSIHRNDRFMVYTAWTYAFTAIVVLLTMKVSFKSWVLEWFGKNLFWIYILQRIPMMLLDYFGVIGRHMYYSFVIVFVATIFLTFVFDRTLGRLTDRMFAKLRGGSGTGDVRIEGQRIQ